MGECTVLDVVVDEKEQSAVIQNIELDAPDEVADDVTKDQAHGIRAAVRAGNPD